MSTTTKRGWRFWTLLAGSAVLPDADLIGFSFGINYGGLLGHRGLSHSLLFAALWSLLVVFWEFRAVARRSEQWWRLLGLFFVATASHGVLDAMTDGGLGVAFFSPVRHDPVFPPVAADQCLSYRRRRDFQWPWCCGDDERNHLCLVAACSRSVFC